MHPQQPDVTVVIPCYNTHAYLLDAIASVRRQTFQNLEVLVVDDGSTDPATIECLLRLGDDVRVVRQSNRGLPAARNKGFAEARGEYVLPLDADDWIEPNTVELLLTALRGLPQTSFAFSHIRLEGERKGVLEKQYNFFEQLFLNQLPYCLMLRKSLWEQAGGYDETMRRGYEDWEFNIRLGSLGCAGVRVPMPLFHYRISGDGMLLRISNRIHGELWEEIRRRHADLYAAPRLLRLWWAWRRQPSTYPLSLYFCWLALARLLPRRAFAMLVLALRPYSHGGRESSRMAGEATSSC